MTVVIGVGNRFRGDDGVGCRVIELMSSRINELMSSKVKLINAGVVPENYIEPVVKVNPARVLFIDACDFGGEPGEFRLFPQSDFERLKVGGFSTHTVPLSMIAQIIATVSNARVWLLGIEPGERRTGADFSPAVASALPRVVDFILSWVINRD